MQINVMNTPYYIRIIKYNKLIHSTVDKNNGTHI